MPIKVIEYGSANYNEMVALRTEILRKPLGLVFSNEELEKEKKDLLIGAFEDDRLMACCILTPLSKTSYKLRQMAVSQKMQRLGIGGLMLQFAENLARDARYNTMIINARTSAIGFYEKMGYAIHGGEFIEVGIPHVEMRKKLL
ncbi:MAG: GNAT family N-acetyltransferase [bacterium]|jgi:predicted GNAT family N-acyltransferase